MASPEPPVSIMVETLEILIGVQAVVAECRKVASLLSDRAKANRLVKMADEIEVLAREMDGQWAC